MRDEQPIVVCVFGWGQTFQLYHDRLCVHGMCYLLSDLTHVQPDYQRLMGIPSARLELHFGRKKLLFRGIAAVEDVRKVVSYLGKLSQASTLPMVTPGRQPYRQERRNTAIAKLETALATPSTPPAPSPSTPSADARAASMTPVVVGFLAGEQVYYGTSATLCGEWIDESTRSTYRAQDHGMLILTDKRVVFVGRTRQIILEYVHLLHVSCLHDVIVFTAEPLQKPTIFAVHEPLECSIYVECMLERFRQTEELPVGKRVNVRW